MRTSFIKNGLVVGVILLLIGVAVQPSVATVQPKEIDIEPKDFLFQTIIDIANNPDVEKLLEQYNHNLFTSNHDYKDVFSKLLFKKPRLLFDVLFTKPSITYEYLDKCYKRGIEITTILGEDTVLEIIESIKVTDKSVLDELNNVIMNDEELSNNLTILKEMNEEIKSKPPWEDYPRLCVALFMIGAVFMIPFLFALTLVDIFNKIGETPILDIIILQVGAVFVVISIIFWGIGGVLCWDLYPY